MGRISNGQLSLEREAEFRAADGAKGTEIFKAKRETEITRAQSKAAGQCGHPFLSLWNVFSAGIPRLPQSAGRTDAHQPDRSRCAVDADRADRRPGERHALHWPASPWQDKAPARRAATSAAVNSRREFHRGDGCCVARSCRPSARMEIAPGRRATIRGVRYPSKMDAARTAGSVCPENRDGLAQRPSFRRADSGGRHGRRLFAEAGREEEMKPQASATPRLRLRLPETRLERRVGGVTLEVVGGAPRAEQRCVPLTQRRCRAAGAAPAEAQRAPRVRLRAGRDRASLIRARVVRVCIGSGDDLGDGEERGGGLRDLASDMAQGGPV